MLNLHILRSILNKIMPKAPIARGIGLLVGGTAGAQLLMIGATPIITRLYQPSDYGILATFTAILGLVNVISCLRYELAIPLPKKSEDAYNLVALSIIIVIILSIAIALLALPFTKTVAAI